MPAEITAEEFLVAYAARSGVPPLQLLERGRVVSTCACSEPDCEGWQLMPPDCLRPHDKIAITAEDFGKPEQPRTDNQTRCEYCGRYRGWLECTKGCGGTR